MVKMDTIVFAGAPYSNSAPLVEQLTAVDARVQVISDHPARLLDDLLSGRADAALLPVVHLFRHTGLAQIDGLGVAADGPVRSVLLKCRVPVERICSVAADPASATSNALAQLLLRMHYGRSVDMVTGEAARKTTDAAVMIGDRALCSEPAESGDIDLAEAWKMLTGLPFVFAVWTIRSGHPRSAEIARIAHEAYAAAGERREAIAARYAGEYGRPAAFWLEYLSRTIHYRLDARDLEAMQRFRALLEIAGAVPPARP